MHQLFDVSGELVAEARFRNYKTYEDPDTSIPVDVPTEVMFLWPRDYLVMEMQLSRVKVNKHISEQIWKPKQPVGYEVVPLTIPDKPSKSPLEVDSQ